MSVKHVVLWHTRQCEVMMDHSIICKIHGSRLTTLVCNEVSSRSSCTKILVFLSMKMELLCPLLFVSSCLSSKRFFFPHFRTDHGRGYGTVKIFCNFQDMCPPPTPSTKCNVKTHVLRYLISDSTCFEKWKHMFFDFPSERNFQSGHMDMHGLFLEKTSCRKKILQCPSRYFQTW